MIVANGVPRPRTQSSVEQSGFLTPIFLRLRRAHKGLRQGLRPGPSKLATLALSIIPVSAERESPPRGDTRRGGASADGPGRAFAD